MTATATDASTQQLLESLTAESLPCQWQGCAESFTSAEQLYNHLTETHIGRKSTGNLNLQCRWGSCNVATVKRDHITSHVRVHVPLKPHTCSICQKSFKRPQDLKKHVKTHADDSVIVPSPVADNRRGPGGPGGYDQHGMYPNHSGPDTTATNYSYAANGHNGDSYQGYNGGAPNGSYHAAAAHHAANHYGPVYYPVAQGHPGAVFSDSRRRAYEDMNDFFGDVKHHRVAPVYSHEITQRLAGLHHILPVIQGGAATVDYQAPAIHSHYQLPQLGNLRTKSELLDGEHFLNALRSTLLESPNAAAAAGVHHPVVHYAPADLNFRSSQSPPHHPLQSPHRLSPGAHPMSSAGHQAPMMAHASSASSHGTHVLTPPPQSQPSMHNSPHASSSAAYPNLSALTTGDVSGGFTVSAGAAPASTVNSLFDRNQSHRIAGNLLQKARKDSEEIEHSDEAPSPSSRSTPGVSDRLAEGLKSVEISPGLIDPLLAGAEDEARKTPEKEKSRKGSDSEGTDEWLEALRVVEALKEFVSRRLTNKEYVDELSRGGSPKASSEKDEAEASGSKSDDEMTELERDRVSLYPILKAVEEDD